MSISQPSLQKSLHKSYNRATFANEVLYPVFGSNLELFTNVKPSIIELTESEKNIINEVGIYGSISLESSDIECYEIILQDSVKIERSKVAIQSYVRRLLLPGQAALINFITPTYNNTWRLTLVAKDSVITEVGIKDKFTNAKRYTYLLGPSESCKTAALRLHKLSLLSEFTLESLTDAFSVEKMSKAFFDEYKIHYEKFCEFLQNSKQRTTIFRINPASDSTEEEEIKACKPIRDFTKKLLGRIVFLYFVQKKGWLGASDTKYKDGSPEFIKELFFSSGADDSFYPNWLSVLFFDTLNQERDDDKFKMPDGSVVKIPFLNGGLFDREEFDKQLLTLPSILFHNPTNSEDPKQRSFLDFLDSYNFTIYEDSPEEHTVAVDPEMLGHIFENLLEDNKDKGAFYTPKEIVHYMCQESLIEYLTTHLSKEFTVYKPFGSDQIELFGNEIQSTGQLTMVEELGDKALNRNDVENIVKNKDFIDLTGEQLKKMSKLLDTVKICDPAIGSGAFPMGLLKEIFAIKELIAYILDKVWKPCEVKLNIIQNSIYGVDIEKGAVDIARLRFWLSLIVDEEKPKPLPNLDYKIVVGNSLVSKYNDKIVEIDWELKEGSQLDIFANNNLHERERLLKEITKKQNEYFLSDKKNKIEIAKVIRDFKIEILINQLELMINEIGQQEIPYRTNFKDNKEFLKATEQNRKSVELQEEINNLVRIRNNRNLPFNHFDWKLDFPEVLNPYLITDNDKRGFDIVIGNPPYDVYQGKKKIEIEDLIKYEIYQKCKGGKINAYELFLAKSHELIKYNGLNCQIFQNSFLADNTSRNLRDFYFDHDKIIKIDSFPERDNHQLRVFESVKMSVCILLALKQKIKNYSFTVNFWSDKYMLNGFSTKFKTQDIRVFDPKYLNIPCLKEEEKSIYNLYYKQTYKYSEYFDCLEGELNMTFHKKYMTANNALPMLIKGAQVQRYFITMKPSQGVIEYVDSQKYKKDFSRSKKIKHNEKPRIALQGISGANDKLRIISSVIETGKYCANSCNYIIPLEENNKIDILELLGIFNSKLTNWVFRKSSTNSNVNCYEVNNLKLPNNSNKFLKNIVEFILFINKDGTTNNKSLKSFIYLEKIIDGMVYELYLPELIKKHNCEIIKHLGDLPKFTDKIDDNEKMIIIQSVYNRLNAKNHPVRINLERMKKEIKEIRIIEGLEE